MRQLNSNSHFHLSIGWLIFEEYFSESRPCNIWYSISWLVVLYISRVTFSIWIVCLFESFSGHLVTDHSVNSSVDCKMNQVWEQNRFSNYSYFVLFIPRDVISVFFFNWAWFWLELFCELFIQYTIHENVTFASISSWSTETYE